MSDTGNINTDAQNVDLNGPQRLGGLRWIWWIMVAGILIGHLPTYQPQRARVADPVMDFALLLIGAAFALATAFLVWRYRRILAQLPTLPEATQKARTHLVFGLLGCLLAGLAGTFLGGSSGGFAGMLLQAIAAVLAVCLYPSIQRDAAATQHSASSRRLPVAQSFGLRRQDLIAYAAALAAGITVVAVDALWAPFTSPAGARLFTAMMLLPVGFVAVVVIPLRAFLSRRLCPRTGASEECGDTVIRDKPFSRRAYVATEWLLAFVAGQVLVWLAIVIPAHQQLN